MSARNTGWSIAVITLGAFSASHAGNGAVGYAPAIEPPVIDGDFSDWPARGEWMPISYRYGASAESDGFDASVRYAFNARDKALYVAIRIQDADYRPETDDGALRSDTAIVYFDPRHDPLGSGSTGYLVSGNTRELTGQQGAFDPAVADASWDGVSAAVRHSEDGVTHYEYRFDLPDRALQSGVIGADIAVLDRDGSTASARIQYWGPYFNKPGQSGRIGDIVLVDPQETLSTVQGRVEWRDGLAPLPAGAPLVRFTSTANADRWIQVVGDESGNYSARLPAGEYEISYPLPVLGGLLGPHDRVASDHGATVKAVPGETVQAETLVLKREPTPELYEARGVLFDWTPKREADLDALVEAWMAYFVIPGVSLAVVHDGKIAYHRVYGVSNHYTQELVTGATIFEAASITKIVFAFAVHRLAEQGVIDLDRPLYQYLAFEELEDDPRYRLMTARHVLTHQAGLPNWRSGDIELAYAPGEGHSYSGEAFEYLKRVVVAVTGKDIEQVLMDEVQVPMGMTERTYFADNDALRAVVAHGHGIERPNAARIPRNVGVAHSMHTESKDLANFMVSLLARKGLEPETYDEMLTWTTTSPPEPSEHDMPWQMGFGQGFGLVDAPHGQGFWHGGNNGDFHARFEAYPAQQFGFVMFANNERGWAMGEVLRRYLLAGSEVPSSLEAPISGSAP